MRPVIFRGAHPTTSAAGLEIVLAKARPHSKEPVPTHEDAPAGQHPLPMAFREFVALMASIMALNALAIDMMLPGLPAIASTYGLKQPNQVQWIISGFMLGNAAGQLIYGPLADRFGRRRVLLIVLAAYTVFGVGAALSATFATLISMRFLQGFAAAGARVMSVAIIRDRFSGARMARVMSLTFIIFLIVPMVAPAVGQLILNFAPWPVMFHFLALLAMGILFWTLWRLPESLHRHHRRPLSVKALARAGRTVLRNRLSLGYTLATTLVFGSLLGFINSIQQIYSDVFHAPQRFPYMFPCVAGTMAITALANSRIVEHVGMRRISHSALLALTGLSAIHLLLAARGLDTEIVFIVMQSLQMGCMSLIMGNFNALGMEPLGALAGSAASLQGFITTLGGTLIGALIGQHYDRSTTPLILGYLGCAAAALAVVLVTERGRLFGVLAPAR